MLAARAASLREVLLPAENEVNVKEDLKAEHLGDLILRYVHTIEEVVEVALEPQPTREQETAAVPV